MKAGYAFDDNWALELGYSQFDLDDNRSKNLGIKQIDGKDYHHEMDWQTIEVIAEKNFKHIAIAIDFSGSDKKSISAALQIGGKNAKYTLLHTVETPGAFIYGTQIKDYETDKDREFLKNYKSQLEALGYHTDTNYIIFRNTDDRDVLTFVKNTIGGNA